MTPARFKTLQDTTAHIHRLYNTREMTRVSMIDAQDMYRSMVAIKARPDKIAWAKKQQDFWTKAYWKSCSNYMNSLRGSHDVINNTISVNS